MRILVCGGRHYDDSQHVFAMLTQVHNEGGPVTCVIHGAATGADTEAESWAKNMKAVGWSMTIERFPADWTKDGIFAGHRRNKRMLDEGKPDLVVAFPGGRGTINMVTQALNRGVRVVNIPPRMRR